MSVKEGLQALVGSPKIASAVSATTTTTGLGTILEWIPNDIGKLATLVGIALSLVLIFTHLRKGAVEYEKTRLEIAILKEKEEERKRNAALRRIKDTPSRRADD